ncbi:MAG: peptidase U32 family protein [Chitinivibrionales bacterium]
MKKHIPELVAPAGSMETLIAAYEHGADCAYVGVGSTNLRAFAPSLTLEQLPEALTLAHELKRKLIVVLNSMPDQHQLSEMERTVRGLGSAKDRPDAVVISDPGVLMLFRQYAPDIRLHLSTQTGTFNLAAARFWKQQGISRIVLPRELSLHQIEEITAKAGVETEVFVHGAMCVSIAGRCLLGSYLSGRHPNHGACPQPCRLRYKIAPMDHGGESSEQQWLEAEEDENGTYLLNAKDLNSLPILDSLVDTGVSALKIEGRNKSVHYISAVVRVYREALNNIKATGSCKLTDEHVRQLEMLDHRTYTTGFYGADRLLQEHRFSKVASKLRLVGVVKGMQPDGDAVVDVKNPFECGESLDLLPVNHNTEPGAVTVDSITDLNGNPLQRALTNRIVFIRTQRRLRTGDLIRRVKAGE